MINFIKKVFKVGEERENSFTINININITGDIKQNIENNEKMVSPHNKLLPDTPESKPDDTQSWGGETLPDPTRFSKLEKPAVEFGTEAAG